MPVEPLLKHHGQLSSNYVEKGKLLHLQGIRGLSICSVIAFHYFPDHFPNGYLGVDIFFVLSGYLMSMVLSKNSTLNVNTVVDFVYRRVKRIVPLYYLVIFITIGLLRFCPCTELGTNLLTARNAVLLLSNINWDKGLGYFEKLGVSHHDLFTHTWSLCLEMQFYLLFPLLWFMQMNFFSNKRMIILHLMSGFSLVLYLISEKKVAFNNVFCRIWQFLLGNMVYFLILENSRQLPTGGKKQPHKDRMVWIFASLPLIVLIYTMAVGSHLSQDYSRITTTVLSILLIYFGGGFPMLENKLIVFFGEISYSWYLVHWPMVVLQRMFEYTSRENMAIGVFVSFLVATIVHYRIEKLCLAWRKPKICIVSLLLFSSCNGLHYYLSYTRLQVCEQAPILGFDFSNMTLEERQAYNINMSHYDELQIQNKGCEFDPSLQSFVLSTPSFEGTCKFKATTTGNKTILVLGNSWAANIAPLIYEECRPYFANIYRTSYYGCEILKPGSEIDWLDCTDREEAYLKNVEKIRPDYLFLTTRYLFFGLIRNETQWASIMKTASERLAFLTPLVKEKIFLLRTFPLVVTPPLELNAAMVNNSEVDWDQSKQYKFDMPTAQKKLDKLMRNCRKCEEINLEQPFMLNGKFTPYDPKYYMAFVTPTQHFSLIGLEKIRPVYTEVCKRIGGT